MSVLLVACNNVNAQTLESISQQRLGERDSDSKIKDMDIGKRP
jgi:hypothetical protein